MVTMPAGHHTRFADHSVKGYDEHLFRVGKALQGAELNEVQQTMSDRVKRIADVLFRDGAIVRDCQIAVDPISGATQLAGGAVYIRGAVRGVAPATLTIPVVGLVQIGIYLRDQVVTENEDATLRDPAIGVRNQNEPGAARLKVTTQWGRAGDAIEGEFYPVHTVRDGVPVPQVAPPQIDAVALALASYDRQSAGGYYVSSGFAVSQLADLGTGEQVYSVAEGIARVDGREINARHATRVVYAPVPDLKTVVGEAKVAAGGTERVNTNQSPISSIDQVLITVEATATIQHGGFSGAQDALPNTPVVSIVAVNQGGTWGGSSFSGGTTFAAGTYVLSSDRVDWSPAGAEPSPGSTYQVRYRYIAVATPTAADTTGFTVTGAVPGTLIQTSYKWKRPRIDRLCLDTVGNVVWVTGVAADYSPIAPTVPSGLLSVASVLQTWKANRQVRNDGVRLVPMPQLEAMQNQIDNLFNVVSDQMLRTEAAISDPTTKKGIFTDPFVDDTKRDAGIGQTAASFDGILTLPMTGVQVSQASLSGPTTLPLDNNATSAVVSQTLRTTCFLVNPYMAFTPIPASAVLQPATDFWTATQSVWLSPVTQRFEETRIVTTGPTWGLLTRFLGQSERIVVEESTRETTRNVEAAELRPIEVKFTLTGFGSGELLNTVKFDGRTVAFTAQ